MSNIIISPGLSCSFPIEKPPENYFRKELLGKLNLLPSAKRINDLLISTKLKFRKKQKEAINSLIRFLNNGKNNGLIKLPTGVGKTFLFGFITKALDLPTIILVPRENLVDGTYDELVGNSEKNIKGLGFKKEKTYKVYGKNNGGVSNQISNVIGENNKCFTGTLIITYDSFRNLMLDNLDLFNILKSSVGLIISDEAHRSLGDTTQEALSKIKLNDFESEGDGEKILSELDVENQLDLIKQHGVIHIHTTATPKLSNKEIDEEVIFESTFGESVLDGDLIMPNQPNLGEASIFIAGDEISSKDNQNPLNTYIFENKKFVYEQLTDEYIKRKLENGGYLPTVAFCNNTEQVEFYVKYLLSKGIKAIQCTTNSSGTNFKDAYYSEKMLESGEADIIVTCSKVGEGWNVPTLRGAMWLCPTISPARVIQSNGRISRVLTSENIERIQKLLQIDRKFIEKGNHNTFIFSPNKWIYFREFDGISGNGDSYITNGNSCSGEKQQIKKVGECLTGLELMLALGEITSEQANNAGIDVEKYLNNFTDGNGKKLNGIDSYLKAIETDDVKIQLLNIGINLDFENKKIDLSNIKSFGGKYLIKNQVGTTLKNIFLLLGISINGYYGTKNVESIFIAKEILKNFFEINGYEVIYGNNYNLLTLDDYKSFIQTEIGMKQLSDLGITLNGEYVDLSGLKKITNYVFGLKGVISELKKIYKLLPKKYKEKIVNYDGKSTVKNIELAKIIFSNFFEYLGYNVNLGGSIKLDSLDDYKLFFNTKDGKKQLSYLGIIIDGNNIKIGKISGIGNKKLGNNLLPTELAKICKLFPEDVINKIKGYNKQKHVITGINLSKDILIKLFEIIGFNVIIENSSELETLSNFKDYFSDIINFEELNKVGIKIFGKEVDLTNLTSPQRFKFKGKRASSKLKLIYNLFPNEIKLKISSYDGKSDVLEISLAKKILKELFILFGYNVEIRNFSEINNLNDYKFLLKKEENINKLREIGIFINGNIVNFSKLTNILNKDFIIMGVISELRNIYKKLPKERKIQIFDYSGNKAVRTIPLAKKILKEFFEELGYIIENN